MSSPETVHAAHRRAPSVTRAQLQALVCEWSLMLKGEGLPPETVLVAVKKLVQEAIAPSLAGYADADMSGYRRDVLITDASQWCIEAYFDRPSSLCRTSPHEANGSQVERPS